MSDKLFLYLVNGEKDGQGFWKISLTTFSDPLEADKCFDKKLEIVCDIQNNPY